MKRLLIGIFLVLLWSQAAMALNISSLALPAATKIFVVPPSPAQPSCTLSVSDPNVNGGAATANLVGAINDVATISMAVTNGSWSHENILMVNGVPFYSVTLPIAVTLDVAGYWQVAYASPGCTGSTITMQAQ